MQQTIDFQPKPQRFLHWTDDSYGYPERSSSVSFPESGGYSFASKVKIGAAWFFFAMMSTAYMLVPIFSLIFLPALLGCVGILTQAYASANEERFTRNPHAPR